MMIAKIISFFSILLFNFSLHAQENPSLLKSGWFPLDPYMYVEENREISTLTGFDIRSMKAILQKAGYQPKFSEIAWKDLLEGIKEGTHQIAPFATKTPAREEWAYFSEPYRWEEDVLFTLRTSSFTFKHGDVADFLKQIKASDFRLGVMEGFVYPSSIVNDFIADPANAKHIVRVKHEPDNLSNLFTGKIDGYLTDRIVGATMLWRIHKSHDIKEHYIGKEMSTPIHFILSKKSVTPQIVEKINASILEMRTTGELSSIVSDYLLPVILMQTIDQDWFKWIEILAIISFVIAGIIIADQENLTIMAAFGLATVPSFGGGIVRDLIIGRNPVGILITPRYMLTVVISFFTLLFVINLYDFFKKKCKYHWVDNIAPSKKLLSTILYVADAMGTSAFTIVGVLVAVSGKTNPLWLWGPLLAVLTGVGGSTIRNALAGYRPLGNETIYTEIPFLCGLGLSIFLLRQLSVQINPTAIFIAVILTMIIGFSLHLLVRTLNIRPLRIRLLK